ncbi:hypothetical protein [Azonexus sp.]|uniref:hypothetical protein n=1 Tax=Azonexus sp. TaxID=1872668 RepID=UPI0035B09193
MIGRLLLTLACLALILAQLPAHLAGRLLAAACAERCRLATTSGTLWRGQGQLYIASDKDWHALGLLAWQLPAGDALARARLEQGQIVWSAPGRIDIDGISLPAAALLSQPELDLPLGSWQGTLQLKATRLQWALTSKTTRANGELHWLGAASGLLGERPLGDYRFDWHWDGETADAAISGGRPGEIRVAGRLDPPRLHGGIELQGEAGRFLAPYLSLLPGLAGNDEDGRYTVDYRWH